MNLELEIPSMARIDSYRSLVAEFRNLGEELIPFVMRLPTRDPEAFLAKLAGFPQGLGISDGFVPHETFWLVADGREVVGVSNLRLRLNESLRKDGGHIGIGVRPSARGKGVATQLLAETLKMAGRRGLGPVLLTCSASNIGSARAIVNNGGVFEGEELMDGRREPVRRYWIEVAPR